MSEQRQKGEDGDIWWSRSARIFFHRVRRLVDRPDVPAVLRGAHEGRSTVQVVGHVPGRLHQLLWSRLAAALGVGRFLQGLLHARRISG